MIMKIDQRHSCATLICSKIPFCRSKIYWINIDEVGVVRKKGEFRKMFSFVGFWRGSEHVFIRGASDSKQPENRGNFETSFRSAANFDVFPPLRTDHLD